MAGKKVKKDVFKAGLELTTIHPKVVRYRVTNSRGFNVLGLHHIEVDREDLPKEDNFNMDFINANLPDEAIPEKNVDLESAQEALDNLKKKQEGYRVYKRYELIIREV